MAFYGFFNKASEFWGGTENTAVTAAYDSSYVPNSVEYATNVAGGFGWGTALTDVWIHMGFYVEGTGFQGGTSTDGEWFRVIDTQGRTIAYADLLNGTLTWGVSDNGSTFTAVATLTLPSNNTRTEIDVRVQVNSGGNNIASIYYDGILISTQTRAWASATGIQHVALTNQDTNAVLHYSEVMVADEDTRGLRMSMMDPDAAGTVEDWDGAYTDWQTRGDGLVVSTPTAAERHHSNLAAYAGPASPTSVRGVFVQTHAKAGATGPTQIDGSLRISTTNYDASDAKVPVDGGPTVFEFTNDPATAIAWDTADFAALQAGLLSVA